MGGLSVDGCREVQPHARAGRSVACVSTPGPARLNPSAALVLSLGFGLATGFAELGCELLRRWVGGERGWLGFHQLNRHFAWMTPASSALVFGAFGLALAAVARRRPTSYRVAAAGLSFLAIFTLALTVHRLHPAAAALLSAGAATSATGPLAGRGPSLVRLARRSVLALAVLLGALWAVPTGLEWWRDARSGTATKGAPNVLLVVLDAVRADALSPYGAARNTTPVLSRLARDGVRFDAARATAPWTLPSHASLFTGRRPRELGVGPWKALDPTFPTLAEYLHGRGYATAGFAANYIYCTSNYGLGRGFSHYECRAVSLDDVLGSSGLGRLLFPALAAARDAAGRIVPALACPTTVEPAYVTRRRSAGDINRAFLDWLPRRRGRPFFAFLNYYDAHAPYVPPASAEHRFGARPETAAERRTLVQWEAIQGVNRWSTGNKVALSARDVALARDGYDDCLFYIDQQLGRLLWALRERGLLDNTLVIVTADHGEEFGEHGLYGHYVSLHRAELDVPLLVYWPPRVPAGQVVADPVSLRDVPATVADLLGDGGRSPFPGRSLARRWQPTRRDGGDDEPVESEMAELAMTALRMGPKVYIGHDNGFEQLFDLRNDPAEDRNLVDAPDERAALAQFRAALRSIGGVARHDRATAAVRK